MKKKSISHNYILWSQSHKCILVPNTLGYKGNMPIYEEDINIKWIIS